MKVKKFNEVYGYEDEDNSNIEESPNLSKRINNFIKELDSSVDDTIFDYILYISHSTKLTEYQNITSMFQLDENFLKFANEKGLDKLKEYAQLDKEIFKKQKEIDDIKEEKKIIYAEASSQLLYKYQEELLEKDFDNFYEFFIKDSEKIQDDIHPDILKKYKDQIKLKLDARKYNL
jgi:hypothetical protein